MATMQQRLRCTLDKHTALMMQAAFTTSKEEMSHDQAKAIPFMIITARGDNDAADCHKSFDSLHGMQ